MGEQLCKKGLRKCWNCKKVIPLTLQYFGKGERAGFRNACKLCEKNRLLKYKRSSKYKETARQKQKQRRLKLRFNIFQRDKWICFYCGRRPPECILEIDHLHPKSKGGKNEIKNYITSCRECNLGKGDLVLREFN